MRSQGPNSRSSSCSSCHSPGLHFLGSPSLLFDFAHNLASAWTTLLTIFPYLCLLSNFSFGERMLNVPGQLQWLSFNASSSRRPSLIPPNQPSAPELKAIPYLRSSNGFYGTCW